jgi:hypothetical protein
LIYLTPGVDGFGVDGFKIRVNSDAGRFDAKNMEKKHLYINIGKTREILPFVDRLLITVACDTFD